MRREDIPNLISILRIFLTIPVVWLLLEQRFGWALVLFFIAGVSDGLDGYLAKRNGWESRLGGLLDPLADKVLLVSSFLSLALIGVVPVWLVLLVILRDLVIVTGALVYHYRIAELEAAPSMLSKINTTAQIILVLSVVLDRGLLALPQWLIVSLVWVVCLTTIASGLDYVWVWSRRAVRIGDRHD
ncbi:MAG: CDP-alcohol phosphatidyltransferase [Candidatus Sedimenticola endophacoides]|uniref:CDP-diacylglycerol--glycerol-3-phosphate 3-phosphatidyltransferase n=1 Tax=Candidatus Sedimenticola endophacoides TaxID=2548426 RepID=A0A657Q3J3_9GAMM|nr:MAG: CDP-alcohol phosphatidyltransferase [Candidatus Sedimenticola endophacoides]OQX37214.1 MAG: CDP-alcohol phosphatidyltransferase [Candidatus Sedimenticola endophacoides]OQX41388.1 MAG: CDP-alcohol phosphatidyltransferase [Candidatus Sedimenticola endophacoides]OQX44342.1 MAG: CDP-alcohol phosphatidyltransferase [Candidatus Sedimenticola endophacoides]OQX48106.1 MAG: CDP-alcohol phosphatidyltransferase [Candidatus Sedimenticola endophacoides]